MTRNVQDNTVCLMPSDAASTQSRCISSATVMTLAKNIAFHSADFLRIAFVTQSLMGRWLHQLFVELKRYDHAPSQLAQQTWIGPMIMGIAAGLSGLMKAINYRQLKKNPDAHFDAEGKFLLPCFSSVWLFIILDVFSPSGNIGTISLAGFIVASAICIPLLAGLFLKLAHPDSNHDIIFSLKKLNQINPPQQLAANVWVRRLNSLTGMKYGITAASTFFETVNRQVNNGTVDALPMWQKGLIGLFAIPAMKIGFELSHHPKFFHGFAALSNLVAYGSLSYDAGSADCFSVTTYLYQCHNHQFCLNETAQTYLTYFCFAMALVVGLFSAATTRFRFQEHHESQETLIQFVRDVPTHARTAGASMSLWCQRSGAAVLHKIKACCPSK